MIPPVPPLDLAGYTARSKIVPADVALVASMYPGYIERRIARSASWLYARLAKRYAVPFGQQPAQPVAVGTTPPPVVLTGRPVLGSLEVVLQVLVAGALGVATFQWSADGGQTWTFAAALVATGTSPPAVTVTGASALDAPSLLVVEITHAGALGASALQWSQDGGNTWAIGSAMAGSGTNPPPVTISGTSNLATPAKVQVQVTGAGALGTAAFQYSLDGGTTWVTGLTTSAQPQALGTSGLSVTFGAGAYATNNVYTGQGLPTASSVALPGTGLALAFPAGTYSTNNVYTGQGILTAPAVVLGQTGLTATFPPVGTYAADNEYSAPTPVPELVLGWIVAMVDVDVWERRGTNAQDPNIVDAKAERDAALADVKEAADSKEGLFDLPLNDQTGGSSETRGGPLTYTEASPFVSADWMQQQGQTEDCNGQGTYGGTPMVGAPWPPPPPTSDNGGC